MSKGKILIIDDLHPAFKEGAQVLDYTVDDHPDITKQETELIIGNYTGIAVRTKFNLDKAFLEKATHLRFVARAGAGMDNIDEAYAKTRDIKLINAPEGNADAVGEHAIGMLLALMNNYKKADAEVRSQVWDREGNRGYELRGKKIGIIGYGFMGQSFAAKLSGFGVDVLAYDKYKTGFSGPFAREVSMEEIVKHADVISFHVPLTRETRQMVNEEYFYHFKKPIFLINTARGEILNTSALLKAIKENKVLGAALDVLETEKFPALATQTFYKDLVLNNKVLLTPHVAGWTFESYKKISEVLFQKLKNLDI